MTLGSGALTQKGYFRLNHFYNVLVVSSAFSMGLLYLWKIPTPRVAFTKTAALGKDHCSLQTVPLKLFLVDGCSYCHFKQLLQLQES